VKTTSVWPPEELLRDDFGGDDELLGLVVVKRAEAQVAKQAKVRLVAKQGWILVQNELSKALTDCGTHMISSEMYMP
jgi:hypothetical protein